jgi:hypothetical protein
LQFFRQKELQVGRVVIFALNNVDEKTTLVAVFIGFFTMDFGRI